MPLNTVYNQWTQFEQFPRFMEGVQEVTQIEENRLYWRAEVGGVQKEWYAKIVQQVPDKVIAWDSEEGAETGGEVAFHQIDSETTQVTLSMSYQPEDIVETVGDKLGFVSRQVEGDLKRFKEFIEDRGRETGAWRGKIESTTGANDN
jgi:uncharacterized membrane protein